MPNRVYKKVGRRYVPIGEFYEKDWLNDGLWLVHSGGRGLMSAPYLAPYTKICDVPKLDITQICSTKEYVDRVCRGLQEYEEVLAKEAKEKGEDYIQLSNWDRAKIAVQVILKANQDEGAEAEF